MTWPLSNQQRKKQSKGLQLIVGNKFTFKNSAGVVWRQPEKAASQHGKISRQQVQYQAAELHHVVGSKQKLCSGTAATKSWGYCYSPNVERSHVQDMMFACTCTQDT